MILKILRDLDEWNGEPFSQPPHCHNVGMCAWRQFALTSDLVPAGSDVARALFPVQSARDGLQPPPQTCSGLLHTWGRRRGCDRKRSVIKCRFKQNSGFIYLFTFYFVKKQSYLWFVCQHWCRGERRLSTWNQRNRCDNFFCCEGRNVNTVGYVENVARQQPRRGGTWTGTMWAIGSMSLNNHLWTNWRSAVKLTSSFTLLIIGTGGSPFIQTPEQQRVLGNHKNQSDLCRFPFPSLN